MRYSNTCPAESLNKTVLFVVRDAQESTQVVSPGRINSDLNVTTSPELTKFGKLSTAKGKQNEVVSFTNRTPGVNASGIGPSNDVSAMNTAMRFVLARMHPTSKLSIMTGNRWPVAMPDTGRGRGRGTGTDRIALFWVYVKQVAERMVKSRRSSSGFLKHSWAGIIFKLLPYVPKGYGGVQSDIFGNAAEFGEVWPARPGSSVVVCKIENRIGMNPVTKELGKRYNQAAHAILGPILQESINREYDGKMRELARRGLAEEVPKLADCGVLVRMV